MKPKNIDELRERLNTATDGAVHRLNAACMVRALRGHVWVVPEEDHTKVLLWGTTHEGKTQYFDVAYMDPHPSLEAQIHAFSTIREAKMTSERIRRGLARLERDQDPEDLYGDESLN